MGAEVAGGCAADEDRPERAGAESFALGDSCRSDVAIRDLVVRPAVVTPLDANGVFDRAAVGFDVAVEPGRGACPLERNMFNFFAGWSLEIVGPGGTIVRSFSGREILDFEGCTTDALLVPVAFEWAGETDAGPTAPPATYFVHAAAWMEMERRPAGRAVVIRRATGSVATVELSGTPTPDELSLLRIGELKATFGAGDAADPEAPPYEDGLLPRTTLDELADLRYAPAGRTIEEEFARQRDALLADPQVPVKPDAAQEDAWRAALVVTHGRIALEWSPLGVPANVAGLTAEPRSGTDANVALAWFDEFGGLLGPLFRTNSGARLTAFAAPPAEVDAAAGSEPSGATALATDGLVLENVRTEGRESVVTFRHVLRAASPSKDLYAVRGDFAILFIDHSSVADGKSSSRVERLWAHWTPQLPAFSPSISPNQADAAALAAGGIADAIVAEPAGLPFVHPSGVGHGKLVYEVLVASPAGRPARRIWVDAVTGEVFWNRDATARRTVEVGTPPLLRPYRREPSTTWKTLPHTYVYAGNANLSAPPGHPARPEPLCTTDEFGAIPATCGIAPGTLLRVALRGPYFEQWTPAET